VARPVLDPVLLVGVEVPFLRGLPLRLPLTKELPTRPMKTMTASMALFLSGSVLAVVSSLPKTLSLDSCVEVFSLQHSRIL
jgi:hypothetical protein